MNKKIISDIVPSKSIRQISIPVEKKKEDDIAISRIRKTSSWQRKPINPKFVLWLIAIICLLALFFGISLVFSSATIIVTPRIEKISFANESFTAKLNSSSPADISFEVLKVTQNKEEIITATEQKEVSQKASGQIVIYNNYSTVPQRLINNTRFEASNGKVYRINSSVVVPGLTKNGGKVVPGSIIATVYADQAGEAYNLKLTDLAGDFKIPGFKGDPRYDSFYARLKTDIAGGFVGNRLIVGDDIRKATEDSLKEQLKEQLLKELYAIKPDNYLFLKDGYNISYVSLPDTTINDNKVEISLEGDLNSIVFNNPKLSKYFATKKIVGFDGLTTEFVPADDFTATFAGKDSTGLWKNDVLFIKFDGPATIKWSYDAEALKKDFAGKSEADFKGLINKYEGSVQSLRVIFVPVWTRYVPDNLNKIRVTEEVGA